MTPALARRGRLIVMTGALFAVVGALLASPPLVSMGGLVLAAMTTAYVAFFPAAVLLRRRKIEMRWWVPGGERPGEAIAAGTSFSIAMTIRNRGYRPLRVRALDVIASSAIEPPPALEAEAPPGREIELRARARARAAGYQVLHGAVLAFGDALGLFEARAYFPNPIEIEVVPSGSSAHAANILAVPIGRARDKAGAHRSRSRGVAGDVRELREHQRGDPFKMIAWKATARRGQLMVRDLETDIVHTHHILVDVAGPLRVGEPGRRPLDGALDGAAMLAKLALARGDRVGLTLFSTRVVASVAPASGAAHYRKIQGALLDAARPFREEEVALSQAELVAAVARYLAYQETADVRLRRAPAPGDPAWNHIVAGPGGELFDLAQMARTASGLVDAMAARRRRAGRPARSQGEVPPAAVDMRVEALRQLCRFRGIELPPRQDGEPGVRATALADASQRASSPMPDSLTLFSDLGCVLDDPERGLAFLGRARRAGRRVAVLAPSAAWSEDDAQGDPARGRVVQALDRDFSLRTVEARRALAARGISLFQLAEGGARSH